MKANEPAFAGLPRGAREWGQMIAKSDCFYVRSFLVFPPHAHFPSLGRPRAFLFQALETVDTARPATLTYARRRASRSLQTGRSMRWATIAHNILTALKTLDLDDEQQTRRVRTIIRNTP